MEVNFFGMYGCVWLFLHFCGFMYLNSHKHLQATVSAWETSQQQFYLSLAQMAAFDAALLSPSKASFMFSILFAGQIRLIFL